MIISAVLLFATVIWFCYSRNRYLGFRHVHDGELVPTATNTASDVDQSEKHDDEKHAVQGSSTERV